MKVIVLDLICFSFFAWFTAQNVPKTSAKFGQETKNEGQDNEHPTLQKRIRNESINLAQYKITCYAHHHIAQAHITKHEHETNLDIALIKSVFTNYIMIIDIFARVLILVLQEVWKTCEKTNYYAKCYDFRR